MPTTLFAALSLFAPVHALLRRLSVLPTPNDLGPAPTSAAYDASRAETSALHATRHVAGAAARANRPLRVLHVMDAMGSGAHAGRMVISGRMADVCAELDRLAALEARPLPVGR